MRIKYILLIIGLLAQIAPAQISVNWSADNGNGTYSNPLIYGDFPDPDVIRVGDTFYFISTSMHYVPGSPICKSNDLINWKMAGYAIERFDEDSLYNMKGGTRYTMGSWANTIRYHDGKFYVGFCTPNSEKPGHFSMCIAKDVAGPWKRTIFPEYMYDPGILFDDDGKVYVAHGQGTIYITELNTNGLSVKKPQQKVYHNPQHPYMEGSHFYKINGMYYMLNSSSAVEMVCLRSKNIYGPYEEKIVMRDTTKTPFATYQPHQGGMVELKDGSWWMIIMQDFGPIGRTPNLIPVTWVNGWPMLGTNGKVPRTFHKPIALKHNKHSISGTSDEFNSKKLELQWQWNHNPDNSKYSLTQRKGCLRLYAASITTDLANARNTLTQRIEGPNSTGITLMDVSGMHNGNIAGLCVFQNPYAYIAIKQENNNKKLIMVNNNKIVSSEKYNETTIFLRAKTDQKGWACFYYSKNGKDFKQLGDTLKMDLGYPWTANRFGLFHYTENKNELNGFVDFHWFRFIK